jgi:hypothetical protein
VNTAISTRSFRFVRVRTYALMSEDLIKKHPWAKEKIGDKNNSKRPFILKTSDAVLFSQTSSPVLNPAI